MEARNYDPALARFTSLDPIAHYSQSPYSAFNNNPIYWADPSGMAGEHYNFQAGRYEDNKGNQVTFGEAMASQGLNENGSKNNDNSSNSGAVENKATNINPNDAFGYESKYPRTMKVMRQLHDFVKSNPSILKQLAEFSGYSTMEVLSQLEYLQGDMTLTIKDLTTDTRNPEGQTFSSTDINLEILNAQHLETLKTNKEIQSFSFFVAVTILHEFVHAGRIKHKMEKTGSEPWDRGWEWERDTFTRTVNPLSADDLYKKYKWNFIENRTSRSYLTPLFKN